MKTLPELVQSLPTELYDEVYKLTFTAALEDEHRVDAKYKPPSCLHVDKESRKAFAQSHYASIFVMKLSEIKLFRKWFMSLTRSHIRMLREVRVHSDLEGEAAKMPVDLDFNFMAGVFWDVVASVSCPMQRFGAWSANDVVKVRAKVADDAHPTWMSYGDVEKILQKESWQSWMEVFRKRLDENRRVQQAE